MPTYQLPFDLFPLQDLDQFALLACQTYNFGNDTDWFSCFRGGTFAVHHRIRAVRRHYYDVHEWISAPRVLGDAEYHLASLLFNLDSALECLVFGLNGLGYAALPADFRDVTDRRSLKQVTPIDLMGSSQRQPLQGYQRIFPQLQDHWKAHSDLVTLVIEHHDVSKHRSTIFRGGQARNDPPPGFFASLGIEGDASREAIYRPMAEIILVQDPKEPPAQRKTVPRDEQVLLEDLVPTYCDFFNRSVQLALEDAKVNVQLKHHTFLTQKEDA